MSKCDRIVGLATIFLIVGALFSVSKTYDSGFSGSMQSLVLPEAKVEHPEVEMRSSFRQQIVESVPDLSTLTSVVARRF